MVLMKMVPFSAGVSNLGAHGPEGIWDRESAVRLELGDFEGLLAWGGKPAGLPVARVDIDCAVGDPTLAQMAGTDLKIVSDQLGHSSIVLTADTYTSVLPAAQYKAVEATAGSYSTPAATNATRSRLGPDECGSTARRPGDNASHAGGRPGIIEVTATSRTPDAITDRGNRQATI